MVIGIATDTLPLPKRVAHESIEFETTQLFGPIAGLNFDIKSSRVETLGGFLFGNGYTSVWASTNFIYPLGATNNPFYAGADLDLEIHFGHDSASGFQNTAGLFIGKQW